MRMFRNNRLIGSLTATSMLATSLLAAPAAAQRVEVGNAATVVGDVEISTAQDSDPRPITRRQRIAWGDLVETGRRSQLQILLLDRSTFGVGARSAVRIDRFVYDPEAGRSLFATFVKGALRFFSGSQEGTNDAEITTPAGRIGIRGTAVDILVGEDAEEIGEDEDAVGSMRSDDDEATLVVLRGPGAETAGGLTLGLVEVESAGVTVVLDQPGLAAYIPRAGVPPVGPFNISNQGLLNIQEELAPEVARAGGGGNGLLQALVPAAIGAIVLGAILLDDDGDVPPLPTGQQPPNNDTAGVPYDDTPYDDVPNNDTAGTPDGEKPVNVRPRRPNSTSQTTNTTNSSSVEGPGQDYEID